MTEAVIVALGRSPIGRARKGSLVDVRPDDLAAYVVNKVLEKVPELDHSQIEDLICGCGLPGGEQGHNIGRVVSILSRLDVPGVTVNRYCSSSLMTTRMAAHSIEAGEGDVVLEDPHLLGALDELSADQGTLTSKLLGMQGSNQAEP